MTGFIIYFTLLSIAHLFFCYFGMHTPRKLTKPLLLLSLAACYACAAKPVDGAVLAALILRPCGRYIANMGKERQVLYTRRT